MNDQILEQIFAGYHPNLKDDSAFMVSLNRKLEAVEYLRQYQQAQQKRRRVSLLLVFVLGIFLGIGTVGLILTLPNNYTIGVQLIGFQWIDKHIQLIAVIPLSVLICYIIGSILNLWQENQDLLLSKFNV